MICPWWLGYFLINPLRRRKQDPQKILSPYVRDGMTVLEPGPGMGFFTLELARLVGSRGRIIAVDLQPRMLATLGKRAHKAGVGDRVTLRTPVKGHLPVDDVAGQVDFLLAFAVVHELPDAAAFFADGARALKPGGKLLLAEPKGHVRMDAFADTLSIAKAAGFTVVERPEIWRSHTAVLVR